MADQAWTVTGWQILDLGEEAKALSRETNPDTETEHTDGEHPWVHVGIRYNTAPATEGVQA